jgi:ribosome-associated toxin RatA of RatAB toxin-antitoxin module
MTVHILLLLASMLGASVASAADPPDAGSVRQAADPVGLPVYSEADWTRLRSGAVVLESPASRPGVGTVVVSAIMRASPDVVWATSIDFQSYPEYVPGMVEARNYVVEPRRIATYFRIKVATVTLEYHTDHLLDPDTLTVVFFLDNARNNDLAVSEGTWRHFRLEDGTTLVRFENTIDTGRALPAWLQSMVMRRDSVRLMELRRQRVEESQRAASSTAPVSERHAAEAEVAP